ncbi:hypothetical protein BDZ89DRAFT_1209125 [Hymenopellis radicata]|nr:hypothetical protein BDZ89DRAFT_1209125 [Hymenopellis radicata]
MQETTTLELHPFGDLPVDIARIIFEIAASLSRPTAVKLYLVSKTVSRWIEPRYTAQSSFASRDWAMGFQNIHTSLFSRCTRLTHLVLSGNALNYGLALYNGDGTQSLDGFDLVELLRPVISCLPAALTTLVISVVPDAYLVTMLPQARSLVKQIIDSDERILMISSRSVYRGLIDGLFCCEGNNVKFIYGLQWEHSIQGVDIWEFAERCIASRKREPDVRPNP